MSEDLLLCLAEKPSAAKKLAEALDEKGKPVKKKAKGVTYFRAERDGVTLCVIPAVGHVFALKQVGIGWNFPTFDVKWVPAYEASKQDDHTKPYVELLMEMAGKADGFIIMTDYDLEGEVIGGVALRCALKQLFPNQFEEKMALVKRMRFSTLTRKDIMASHADMGVLDERLFRAGLARHYVDWIFGINLSRALTLAVKDTLGPFTTLSTGRVQGPTLSFLVKREQEIALHIPVPFWTIQTQSQIAGKLWDLEYKLRRIPTLSEARTTEVRLKELDTAVVTRVREKIDKRGPPVPFDLGGLQSEAFRYFHYTPSKTLSIAEKLYLDALISYPRTSSQKLPASLDHRSILGKLAKIPEYGTNCRELLENPKLAPNEGRKTDLAHPAIHPTGESSTKLTNEQKRVFDLIVRRYLAVFGDAAEYKSTTITMLAGDQDVFELKGRRQIHAGWISLYHPYGGIKEIELPILAEGDTIQLIDIRLKEGFSSAPHRLNPSSLLKLMEKERIGTKATRSSTIDTLYRRGYVNGTRLEVTTLGLEIYRILDRYSPEIVDVQMTRVLEEHMRKIQEGELELGDLMKEATDLLLKMLEPLELDSIELGLDLFESTRRTRQDLAVLAMCPICKTGTLRVVVSKKSGKRFVGCSGFWDSENPCDATFPIPQKGTVIKTDSQCKLDGHPQVLIKAPRRKPWLVCLNPECETRRSKFGNKKAGKPSDQQVTS